METEIRKQYKQANKEITEKWNNYMERAGKRLESRQNALSVALKSGDKESIAKAKKSLEDAQRAVTFHDTKYKAMVEDTALRISKANQTALDYVNGKTPNIYANNFNQINGDAKKVGIKFTTINEDVVRKRIAEGDIKLPKPRVSVPKDVRWNTKKMNSAVLQGILQGESMNDIAKRLLPIVDSNASSAIRNARTLVTQAENSGRLDSYKALKEQGAWLLKVWMATPDDRTRESHLELDGQERDIDEPFIDMDGNELMFPADPDADPSTVYNCRCTMVTKIVAVEDENEELTFLEPDEDEEHAEAIAQEFGNRMSDEDFENDVMEEIQSEIEQPAVEQEIIADNTSDNPDDYVLWDGYRNEEEYERMVVPDGFNDMVYGWDGYVGTSNSFDINEALRYGHDQTEHNAEVVEMLQNGIMNNQFGEDVQLVRLVGNTYMRDTFGVDYGMLDTLINHFDSCKDVVDGFIGTVVEEKGFMSASTNVKKNVFGSRPVQMRILAPKGTNVYVTNNFGESECIFKHGVRYKVLGMDTVSHRGDDKLRITMKIIQ